MPRRLTLILALSALITLLLAQPSSAAIGRNTIDPLAIVSHSGRQVTATGPIACDPGETLRVRLTVSQAGTGAYGEGFDQLECSGELQQWTTHIIARGVETFEEGFAEACAIGITRERMHVTDIHQWCAANGLTLETRR